MLALSLEGEELRSFMNKLLAEDVFDGFVFREAVISSFSRFEIDGRGDSENPLFPDWRELRPFVFSIIKGRAKPKVMRIVLSWPEDGIEEIDRAAKSLFLNIAFEADNVLLTTGCSTKTFTLDKSAEQNWDEFMGGFLGRNGIGKKV